MDLKVLNHLILKGRQEYQETMNFWKQREHVLGRLIAPRGRPSRSFLEKFYEGASSLSERDGACRIMLMMFSVA